MVQSVFCLSWDSHKSSICDGLSSLQQSGEFVDMTIAADGHFVKVHQMVMALASPYLKELITSAPCQHPVLFLNNVSHKSLCSLLEYIYTGEALIPAESLSAFVETAKALHIKGLESMISGDCLPPRMAMNVSQLESNDLKNMMTSDKSEQMNIPVTRKLFVKPEISSSSLNPSDSITDYAIMQESAHDSDEAQRFTRQTTSFDTQAPTYIENNVKDKYILKTSWCQQKIAFDEMKFDKMIIVINGPFPGMVKHFCGQREYLFLNLGGFLLPSNLQFTVSIRGSLQVILNRYIYNLHSVTKQTGVRRWRCVDYRNHKCMAFVVSKKNVVLSRGNLHNHAFHDKKILSKIEKNAVYSALDDVEGYRDKEPSETAKDDEAMDQREFLSLDFSENENETDVRAIVME